MAHASDSSIPPDVGVPGRRVGQRVAWGALAVWVIAGAAGVFGSGPCNHASLASDGLRVEYEPVLRVHAPSELRLVVDPVSPERVAVALEFDRTRVQIEEAFPEPARQRALATGAELEFETGGSRSVQIALRLLPLLPGRHELRLAADGRPPLHIRQRMLP